MQSAFASRWVIGRGAAMWLVALLVAADGSVRQTDIAGAEGMRILTRGPVHEAFANLAESESAPGRIFTKAPPDDIEELPPGWQPAGDNVAWIPGYWSWDDDREDYIWLSGVWRDVPPNRQWVPGYWTEGRGGWQFVSGFWSDVARNEIDYLPAPPAPLETGPSSPSLGVGFQWAPGSWVWLTRRYAWQPGYWVAAQPHWVWTPAHYVWTPRGYVYVSAFWDYDVVDRGIVFAPVYYSSPVYRRPNYSYSPSITIDISFMLGNFFVHSGSHHYYYGDYYDDRYRSRGYEPWYSRHDRYDRRQARYFSDPLYASYRSEQIRRDRDWDKHVQEQYEYRREHEEARPPRTFAEQTQARRGDRQKGDRQETTVAARRLDPVAASDTRTRRLVPVEPVRRDEIRTRSRDVRNFRTERQRIEVEADSAADVAGPNASEPAPPVRAQPRARPADRVQPEQDPTGTQPGAVARPTSAAKRTRKAGEQPAREATRTEPPPVAAGPSAESRAASPSPKQGRAPAASERGRDEARAKPVRRALRESPIAARHSGKVAPPPPDLPKPVANQSDAASGRQSPGDEKQKKAKAHEEKGEQAERKLE